MDDLTRIEPRLALADREELGHLAYFLNQWNALHGRGLVSDDAYQTIEAETGARRSEIERQGRYQAALFHTHNLMGMSPEEALIWADRALALAPEHADGWLLAVELRQRLKRADEARALGDEAATRFPALQERLAKLCIPLPADWLAQAREAHKQGRDADLIALCDEKLADDPNHFDALVFKAFALQRLGRLDAALLLYERLRRMQPESGVWADWIRTIRSRQSAPLSLWESDDGPSSVPKAKESLPSWQDVAGEFMQDHWQKLVLCLAVLLIVVSSNVGAYQLLGPRLWSPVGKTVLALVYTAMFAGFGLGLARWGAERAGQMMLVTALIVVPANFMLAGQMGLLTDPSAFRLTLLACDALALFLLIRTVTAALAPKEDWTLAVALFALGACNVATTRGIGIGWGYVALLAPAVVYLAAVWRTNARTAAEGQGFLALALALLTFTFASGTVRTGAFALEPLPCLFAVPALALAIAGVGTARRLEKLAADARAVLLLRFGGLVVSGLAIALALSRPPGPSPLFSGNTLATALVALALYAACLRTYRQPAYLYMAFGALFLGYFGAFYFVVDLVRAVEEAARQALGYQQKLPFAFKSLNGLVFNTALAGLSLFFARRWRDDRLARHCHYIGVPFSIAACLLSGFEPKAAVLCLSGYAVLYAVAVRVFAEPRLIYLACAALTGAAWFGGSSWLGLTIGVQGMIAALLGMGFWALRAGQGALGVSDAYRRPLAHSALAVAALALYAGKIAATTGPLIGLATALTFWLVAVLCVLLDLDESHPALAYLAAFNANIGFLLLTAYAASRWGWRLSTVEYALAAATSGLLTALLAARFQSRPGRIGDYALPLFHITLAQSALCVGLGGVVCFAWPSTTEFGTLAVALAVVAAGLMVVASRASPRPVLAHLTLAALLGVWLCGFEVIERGAALGLPTYGTVLGAFALVLLVARELIGTRSGTLALFAAELPVFAFASTLMVVVLAHDSPIAMGLVALSFVLMVKGFRQSAPLYPALAALGWSLYDSGLDRQSDVGLIVAALIAAVAVWALGALVGRSRNWLRDWLRLPDLAYDDPFFHSAVVLGLIAAGLRLFESVARELPWTALPGVPMALAFLWVLMLKPYPSRSWVYGAVGLMSLAVAMIAAPWLKTPLLWMPILLALALLWESVSRGVERFESVDSEDPTHYNQPPALWGLACFTFGSAAAGCLVIVTTLAAVFGSNAPTLPDNAGLVGWAGVVLALGLTGAYLATAQASFGSTLDLGTVLVSGYGVFVLGLWWLGAPSSPLVRSLGMASVLYFPIATAMIGLASVVLGPRVAGWSALGLDGAERLDSRAWKSGALLAVVAVVFTRWDVHLATVVTLLLATVALGIPALGRDRIEPAYLSSAAGCAAAGYLALVGAWWFGWTATADAALFLAGALTAAVFGLWALSGPLRRSAGHEVAAGAFEQVALAAGAIATGAVVLARIETGTLGDRGVLLGVGVLLALALCAALLAGRRRSEGLVYVAQALLLGGFLDSRSVLNLSPATDAILLTSFGYLDLGLAEIMQRLRLHVYARPTFACALALPMIALGLSLWNGPTAEINLFFLLVAATFYAVACVRTRWKPVGYASAILFNALLWLVWGRVGFQLADQPQFFLVPVGLSAILFAEVNRREFGAQSVNAIRALGLSLVYLSLAYPIWQTQSFGAWLTLLALSLTGIFVGIGLRAQSFLWLGLIGFVLDVVYQLGRLGAQNSLAKWGIMLALGVALFLFVALNEKKQIAITLKRYYEEARSWE